MKALSKAVKKLAPKHVDDLTRAEFDKLPLVKQTAYAKKWVHTCSSWPTRVGLVTKKMVDTDLWVPKVVKLGPSTQFTGPSTHPSNTGLLATYKLVSMGANVSPATLRQLFRKQLPA